MALRGDVRAWTLSLTAEAMTAPTTTAWVRELREIRVYELQGYETVARLQLHGTVCAAWRKGRPYDAVLCSVHERRGTRGTIHACWPRAGWVWVRGSKALGARDSSCELQLLEHDWIVERPRAKGRS